jgi:hypothetical protein
MLSPLIGQTDTEGWVVTKSGFTEMMFAGKIRRNNNLQ